MNLLRCSREAELKEQMESGHWPEASTTELRAHVAVCSGCRDAVLLRQSFRAARAVSVSQAQLPPPGLLWWRAQLRRRNEAVERVNRPIARAQRFALLINLLAAVALLASQWRHGYRLAAWLSGIADAATFHPTALWAMAAQQPGWNLMVLIPCVVAVVALGGITVYLATDR